VNASVALVSAKKHAVIRTGNEKANQGYALLHSAAERIKQGKFLAALNDYRQLPKVWGHASCQEALETPLANLAQAVIDSKLTPPVKKSLLKDVLALSARYAPTYSSFSISNYKPQETIAAHLQGAELSRLFKDAGITVVRAD